MIILIHGNDITSSRRKLRELTSREDIEKVFFDGNKIDLNEILVALESVSLLAGQKLIIIENFLTGVKNKEKAKISEYLLKTQSDNQIIFWENKEIEKKALIQYKDIFKIFKFEFPASLFSFLDSLGLAPAQKSLNDFQMLVKDRPAEIIFAMIARQFKLLIQVKDDKAREKLNLPGWQIYKLKRQAQNFTLEKLILNFKKLLVIDYHIKSGKTPYSLVQLLDIYLATL